MGAASQARLPGAVPRTEWGQPAPRPRFPLEPSNSCGAHEAPPWDPDVEEEAVLIFLSRPCWKGQQAHPKSVSFTTSGAPGSNGTVSQTKPCRGHELSLTSSPCAQLEQGQSENTAITHLDKQKTHFKTEPSQMHTIPKLPVSKRAENRESTARPRSRGTLRPGGQGPAADPAQSRPLFLSVVKGGPDAVIPEARSPTFWLWNPKHPLFLHS